MPIMSLQADQNGLERKGKPTLQGQTPASLSRKPCSVVPCELPCKHTHVIPLHFNLTSP